MSEITSYFRKKLVNCFRLYNISLSYATYNTKMKIKRFKEEKFLDIKYIVLVLVKNPPYYVF